MTRKLWILSILAIIVCACSRTPDRNLPDPIEQLVKEYESGPVGASPRSIWKYSYNGTDVFYVPLSLVCCDQFSELYDRDGEFLCAPDGGLAGDGDGKCPDFIVRRADGMQVWKDPRLSASD
jgi:hypothetical protein